MKENVISRMLSFVATAFLLGACTTPINPSRPPDVPAPPAPVVADSTIAIPVKIDLSALVQAAEVNLSTDQAGAGIFWRTGWNVGHNTDLQVGVNRSGPVTASTSDGCILMTAPLQINNGRVDWWKNVLGAKIRHNMTFGGSGNVKIKSCLQVTPDWIVNANLVPNFVWTESPWVDVNPPIGHIKISLEGQVDPILQSKLPAIAAKANEMISGYDVKSKVSLGWQAAQRPLMLSTSPSIYLDIQPSMISVPAPKTDATSVLLNPAIVTKLVLRAGAIGPDAPSQPLPPNSATSTTDEIFISLQASAQFTEINKIIKSQFEGKTFDLGDKKSVTINQALVSSYGPNILVKLDVSGVLGAFKKLKGVLYLVGKPSYNDATRKISLINFNYHVDTSSVLVDELAALTREPFLFFVRDKLVIDMSGKIDPLRQKIEGGLKDYKVTNGVTADISVASIGLSDIFISSDSIGIVTVVKGKAQLNVKSI